MSRSTGITRAGQFTLIELLVVIVIIGIVLTLAVAPFDKLTGATGVNGATSMIATQIRACRQQAISSRTRTAIVIYSDPSNGFNQAIRAAQLYRNDSFKQWVPNTSWTFMPTPAVIENVTDGKSLTFPGSREKLLPIWNNASSVTLDSIVFKPTGKLSAPGNPTIKISDALWDGASFVRRGAGNNWQQIEVNQFTGRTTVSGP